MTNEQMHSTGYSALPVPDGVCNGCKNPEENAELEFCMKCYAEWNAIDLLNQKIADQQAIINDLRTTIRRKKGMLV